MKALYQFSAGESFLHRLDPRTKLLLITCILVATFLFPQPWVMPLIPMALLWVLGKIPPWEYGAFLVLMVPLIVAITVIQAFSGGPPHLGLELFGVISVSEPGLAAGLAIALRLTAMGIAFVMFSMTTDPFDWGLSMYKSGLPYRVAFMFAFAMRFFPLLQEELGIIRSSLAARGSDVFSITRPVRFLRGIGMSVVPLGVGALRRSQDIALAMELRGFGYAEEAGIKRTLFRDIRLATTDYAAMLLSATCLVAVVIYAAQAGTLPQLGRGQSIFGIVLVVLLTAVAFTVNRALRPARDQATADSGE